MATETNLQKLIKEIAIEIRTGSDLSVRFQKDYGLPAPAEMTSPDPFQAMLNQLMMRSMLSKEAVRAFKTLGFDPDKSWHWVGLIEAFTKAIFASPGRGDSWDDLRYLNLAKDIVAITKKNENLNTDISIARALRKDHSTKRRYGAIAADTLRKRVSQARNSSINALLNPNPIEGIVDNLKLEGRIPNESWLDFAETAAKKAFEVTVLQQIMEEQRPLLEQKVGGPLSPSQYHQVFEQLLPELRKKLAQLQQKR